MIDKDKLEGLIGIASKKLGKSPDELKNAVSSGSINDLMKNLKPDDVDKLQNVLKDKAATDKLLSSPQAQFILKKILGDK